MGPQRLIAALLPALAATLAGAVALVATGDALGTLAAAALGAAAASLATSFLPRADQPRIRPANAIATSRPATAVDGAEAPRLLDALPVGLMVVSAEGAISFANRHAAELFGLPATGGLAVATIRARRLLDGIEAALADRTPGTIEFRLARSGEAHLRAHIRPVESGGGEVVVAIEDQTAARRAGELHRDFVANASHELKTPLAAVSAIIETLLGHAREDPAATERFLGMLAAQTQRMTRLVEDLLSLNRIELNERVTPREPQDLAGVIGEVVDALRASAEAAGVRLDYVPPEGRPLVRGERNELSQLFRNLIDNAIKYGGPGTEVSVAAVLPQADAAGLVGIAVRDTGPGIARQHIPRLTERFYRVSVKRSREKGGTGLGLAIVKHIVNRHRGRLEIESELGKGSSFTVWLPLAGAAAQRDGAQRDGAQRDGGAPPLARAGSRGTQRVGTGTSPR